MTPNGAWVGSRLLMMCFCRYLEMLLEGFSTELGQDKWRRRSTCQLLAVSTGSGPADPGSELLRPHLLPISDLTPLRLSFLIYKTRRIVALNMILPSTWLSA